MVAAVGFALRPGDPAAIAARLAEFRAHRRATQPQGVRTFGSVFTNPPGDSAGRLLEAAGCKGLAVGGARFSPVHANFIEARAGLPAADVLALMAEGRAPGARPPAGRCWSPRCATSTRERGIVRAAAAGARERGPRDRRGRRARRQHPAVAERRRQVVRDRGRRRRSGAMLVVVTAAAVARASTGSLTGPLLAIQNVALTGYDRHDRTELARALQDAADQGTVLSPAGRRRCRPPPHRFPWVASISVARDWPRGLAIHVSRGPGRWPSRPRARGPVLVSRAGPGAGAGDRELRGRVAAGDREPAARGGEPARTPGRGPPWRS